MACTWRDGTSVHEGQKGWCVSSRRRGNNRAASVQIVGLRRDQNSFFLSPRHQCYAIQSPHLRGYPQTELELANSILFFHKSNNFYKTYLFYTLVFDSLKFSEFSSFFFFFTLSLILNDYNSVCLSRFVNLGKILK